MTFDLILSSLYYHGREWFVFQDILTHLPQEKAALATERSKTIAKYTYRFGITRDWVSGESRKILVDRHFIESSDPGRSLIFSSVLVDAARVEELFTDCFTKKFRLKVQQFHLTSSAMDSSWFEWQFDPKQKDNGVVKKTKLTVPDNERQSSLRGRDKTPQKTQSNGVENLTPNTSQKSTVQQSTSQSQLSLKRRRAPTENGNTDFVSSISETVLTRPRKKAKEANDSISKYVDEQQLDEQDEKPEFTNKKEPMSPEYKPDVKTLDIKNIKRSLSPLETKSTSSSPQRIVKDDVMLSSVSVKENEHSDTDYILPTKNTNQESNSASHKSDQLNQSEEPAFQNDENPSTENAEHFGDASSIGNDISIDETIFDDHNMPDDNNNPDDDNEDDNLNKDGKNAEDDNIADTSKNAEDGNSPSKNNEVCNVPGGGKTNANGNVSKATNADDKSDKPDSNIPDKDVPKNDHDQRVSSPTSSLLDNSKNIMDSIKLREQQLCNEESMLLEDNESSEVETTSANTSTATATHSHDCGAEACSSSAGASSTVCLCSSKDPASKKQTLTANTEASELLEGLKSGGFVPLVRQLLENVTGDTRLSQMEAELSTLGNQIRQKRKTNQQLQMNIKRKARELEKLFENLRKGKANCEMLEQKHKALQLEKSTVEAKVKKCLEVLNSVD